MTDYTVEMFHQDYAEVSSRILPYISLASLEPRESDPEKAVQEVMDYFISKYGKQKGLDYEMRFLSVQKFIAHYQNELPREGLADETNPGVISVHNELLQVLLDSFRNTQSPGAFPSSTLFNQNREFNYRKVIKAVKTPDRKG